MCHFLPVTVVQKKQLIEIIWLNKLAISQCIDIAKCS